MSGHSKWANIKRRKEVVDAKKGKLFSKLARDITVSAREGGGDINANPTLRALVDKAKALNLAKNKIDRAIAKGTGTLEGTSYVESFYEGYGPGGVAVLVECLTDNKNRTVTEVRTAFSKNNGNLADAGSVAYVFSLTGGKREPTFKIPLNEDDEAKFQGLLGALGELDDVVEIYHNAEIIEEDSEEED
jgi:YebC/PmpR family DNA-binding regulatory protein